MNLVLTCVWVWFLVDKVLRYLFLCFRRVDVVLCGLFCLVVVVGGSYVSVPVGVVGLVGFLVLVCVRGCWLVVQVAISCRGSMCLRLSGGCF